MLFSLVVMGTTSQIHPAALLVASCLAASLAAGCVSPSFARRVDADRKLSVRVHESIAASPLLSGAKVAAKAHSGVVALLGEVPEEALKREAATVAAEVPGVVRVNNLILVVNGGSKAEGSAPAKSALILSRAP